MSKTREGESNKAEQAERHFDQWQYDFLKQCSEKGDEGIKEWNEWRRQNPLQDVFLEGALLRDLWLRGINFGTLSPTPITSMQGKKASYAYLSGAQFQSAHIESANLELAHLEMASLHRAHLEGAYLQYAHLQRASLPETWLAGAIFDMAHLEDAKFMRAIVDGATSFWRCYVDRETDFSGVSLANTRIDPAARQLLEYNIRRLNWEQWYRKDRFWHRPIRLFWWISDYGLNAIRIIKAFFVSAMLFALIYYVVGALDHYVLGAASDPGLVSNLFVENGREIRWYLVPLGSLYFSVVTMTTLGFGDVYANAHSVWWAGLGHLLLMIQVILGYVLLGALVTRFAVLFTAGGPAGKFAEGERK